jgi:hypothetical protein
MQTDRNTLTVMHNKLAFRSTFGALQNWNGKYKIP